MKVSEKYNDKVSWRDISIGGNIAGGATSREFKTGEWRVDTPKFDMDKCIQCLLCIPVCPDSSIPVVDKKREDFDLDHCKGCGICAKVCPVGAIEMLRGE